MLNVGDILVAKAFCGFPDNTTQGKEYVVSRTDQLEGLTIFWIIDDDGVERIPVSTSFRKKETINS